MVKFSITPFPKIYFGEGEFLKLPEKLKNKYSYITIITGSKSTTDNPQFTQFLKLLDDEKIDYTIEKIISEPTPQIIDSIVAKLRSNSPQAIIAVGGGSVLDAGKAVAAMLTVDYPIINYLESVGTKSHPGTTLPLIAVPTTAGTGSEATKNAVITQLGKDGFKKSLRHDNFIAAMAIIDPLLMLSCPPQLTAACGMDTFTQLLESFVSNIANPLTDSLAFGALEKVVPNLPIAYHQGDNINARSAMAYGAMISGITLANSGLGIVHGFASSIGAFYDIPHGIICGTLLPSATEINILKLKQQNDSIHSERLNKHLKVARLFPETMKMNNEQSLDFLIEKLYSWTSEFNLPKLSYYGISAKDFPRIKKETGLKNNPVQLTDDDLSLILRKRL